MSTFFTFHERSKKKNHQQVHFWSTKYYSLWKKFDILRNFIIIDNRLAHLAQLIYRENWHFDDICRRMLTEGKFIIDWYTLFTFRRKKKKKRWQTPVICFRGYSKKVIFLSFSFESKFLLFLISLVNFFGINFDKDWNLTKMWKLFVLRSYFLYYLDVS